MSKTNRQVICDVLCEKAKKDKDIFVLCSDSRGSSSMSAFFQQFPSQSIEMGIAEQNLVTVAAGLAKCGKKAYVASPACFLTTRSYEQIKVDVAYSFNNVKLIGVSGGVSYGALGMTHHSLQDIAAINALVGMRTYLPSDEFLTRKLMEALSEDNAPAYIRVSRNASEPIYDETMKFTLNKALVHPGKKEVVIVGCGETVANALKAKQLLKDIDPTVIDMYCLKPFDEDTLLEVSKQAKLVLTVEEHSIYGGLNSLVCQTLSKHSPKKVVGLSLPDEHLIGGNAKEIFANYGLDGEGIQKAILEALK